MSSLALEAQTPQCLIRLRGVRTNNLKAIDVDVPVGELTVVTGVSGSGKSSLVFDTLYAEAYRRYVESLSSFARQYLKALPKPEMTSIQNLPPAIAVRQSRSGATSRSTVGTMTELYDVLRVLYMHLSTIHCRSCGQVVERETGETVARKLLQEAPGEKALFLAPLSVWGKMKAKELTAHLLTQGFTRLWLDGEVKQLEEVKAADMTRGHVVVDRLTLDENHRLRIIESGKMALKLGRGQASVAFGKSLRSFSADLECCGVRYFTPSMGLFSFNHPLGACPECQGFGQSSEINWDKVIPDKNASLATQGIACWNFGEHVGCYREALESAAKQGWKIKSTPFAQYTAEQWHWLKQGEGNKRGFEGIAGYFAWLDSKRYKPHYRIHSARFRKYVLCPTCKGARLRSEALACLIKGKSIADVCDLSIKSLQEWLDAISVANIHEPLADGREKPSLGVAEALDEAQARVAYLLRVGVGYLTLNRTSKTLSGGETQRINMARCVGSVLTDTLFCLDEPTVGLHPRDSRNLLQVIHNLRDQGNTVVVVEHEQIVIKGADHFIEIGPEAGHLGGHVVYQGKPQAQKMLAPTPGEKTFTPRGFIKLEGAATHNLKSIDVRFPVGAVTGVCGVSGSGKTSLIQHTLYPLLASVFAADLPKGWGENLRALGVGPHQLITAHAGVMLVSQAALGRSSRSNIATYLGLMDEIRKLLATTPEAQAMKLTAGSFSFNTPGGRCETCAGIGTVVEDLSFLGEMSVRCPTCQGRRFQENVLQILWQGKNLLEILAMTVAEARAFFYAKPRIAETLTAVMELGLGYVTLGQSTSSFSGGEAQRLKLVDIIREARGGKPSILIFDEPSSGLSDADVEQLVGQFITLSRAGHTIIVVEHHVGLLRRCDWLVEIGPEASEKGGELVYEGPPQGLAHVTRSVTAPFLWPKS